MKSFAFWFEFHWSFVLKVPIYNKSALVQVMDWQPTGDMPLPEPMFAEFTDAYMRHKGELTHPFNHTINE